MAEASAECDVDTACGVDAGGSRGASTQPRVVWSDPRAAEVVAAGMPCHRKTAAKVLREAGIRSKSSRTFRVTTTDSNHAQPVAANVLARDFTAEMVHQKWVSDITYIATLEGWLY